MTIFIKLLPLFLTLVFGCTRGGAFSTGDNEEKPGSGANPGQPGSTNGIINQDIPIANATYYMTVKANAGNQLCDGNVRFTFSSGFNLSPVGTLKCAMVGDRDLNKMLGVKAVEGLQEDMSKYAEFGKILRVPNPVNPDESPTFTPPKPDRIGPLIQNDAEFVNYRFEEKTHVSYINDKKKHIEDDGKWTLIVHEVNGTTQPAGYTGQETFTDVIVFELQLEGLDKGPKSELNAFESMTYYYNVRPIRVPKIVIKSKLKDVFPNPLSSLGDLILGGGITIELNLRQWEAIKSPNTGG